MKTIHDMQVSRRVTASHRPLAEPTLDSLAADIEILRAEVAACHTLLAEIHDTMGIARHTLAVAMAEAIGLKPKPGEPYNEPDEPF